jgi:MFS family permease
MLPGSGLTPILRTMRDPVFRNFMLGSTLAWIGSWLYRTGVGWLTWELTGSAGWLGIVGFVDLAPSVIITPLAGVLSDRMARLRLIRIVVALSSLQAVVLGLLVLSGKISIAWLLILTLFHGIVEGSLQPPVHAIVPSMVERRDLTTAFAINSITFNLSRFIGPPIAGLLVHFYGTGWAILASAVGGAAFLLAIISLKINEDLPAKSRDFNLWGDIRAGVYYAVHHDGLRPILMSLTVLAMLAFPLVNLLPGFADGVFGMGANGLAWMTAAMGLGAVIQGSYLAQRGPVKGLTAHLVTHILVMAFAILALCATDIYWFGLIAMVGVGYAQLANRSGAMSLMQTAASGDMRGRVASFYGMVSRGVPALGSLLIGGLAEIFGLRETMAAAGALVIVLWFWMRPRRAGIAAAIEN